MGVVTVDTSLFVDTMMDMQEEPRYEHLSLTGIYNLDKIKLYSLVIDTLDGTGLRYGHMLEENVVVFSTDDLPDYVEELTESIQEELASYGPDALPKEETSCADFVEDYFCGGLMYGDIEDESEAFMSTGTSGSQVIDAHAVLSDFIQEALELSLRVLTGGYREISTNSVAM